MEGTSIDSETAHAAPSVNERLIEWLSLPEGVRAELLNGHVAYKAMSTIEHGDAIGGIWGQIHGLRGRRADGSGWWLSENVKMYLSGQGVQPDMVGWRIEKHPRPPHKVNVGTRHLGVYVTPPDWVCEVLSPSTSYRDRGAKWGAYHDVGVAHYWLVDVANEMLRVYSCNERTYEMVKEIGRDDVAELPPFAGLEFSGKGVFLMTAAIKDVAPEDLGEQKTRLSEASSSTA